MNISLTPPTLTNSPTPDLRSVRSQPVNILCVTAITLALTLLVACGGGSSNSPNTLSAVRDVLRDRAARADTYFLDVYGTEPNNPDIIRARSITCSGVKCSYALDFTDALLRFEIDLGQSESTPTPSLDARITSRTDNITFYRLSSVSTDVNPGGGGRVTYQEYGGWMSGNVFGVTKEIYEDTENPIPHSEFYGHSFGNSPGTNPTGTGRAEWRGAMIGMRDSNQNVVRGDVSVDIDNLASPDVDVNISNITDTVTNDMVMWKGQPNFGWDNLILRSGRFDTGANINTGANIKGSFYGENHEEVGGVFHTGSSDGVTVDGITGAFGAKRQ